MGQDIFDLVIVLTLVFFTIRGVSNGLVGEVAGIFALVGGFWAAKVWNAQLAPYLDFIASPSWRVIAAYAIIFIVVMLAIGLLARILKKIIAFSFVGWLDKIAGGILGLAKGILIWALIFVVLEKLLGDAPFMRDSRAYPYFQTLVEQIRQWLPEDFAHRLGL